MVSYATEEAAGPRQMLPWANIGLITVNFLVFFYELSVAGQGGSAFNGFINDFSLVPCEYTRQCAAYPGTPAPFWITLFTSMFLHAGWDHILGNMLFLFVFGNDVNRAMGHLRYLAFYLICGVGASALEIATAAGSSVPGLGASGAISGVLAAFLVLYPTSRIGTLIPIGIIFLPARMPAWVFIVLWFVVQLLNGLASLSGTGSAAGDVAYFAHVGGFVTGLVLVRFFTRPAMVQQLQEYHRGL